MHNLKIRGEKIRNFRFYFFWNCLIFPVFPRFPQNFPIFLVLFLLKLSYFSGISEISKNFPVNWTIGKRVGNPRWSVSVNILFSLRADEFADKHVISQRSAIIVEVTTLTSAFVCKILSHYRSNSASMLNLLFGQPSAILIIVTRLLLA